MFVSDSDHSLCNQENSMERADGRVPTPLSLFSVPSDKSTETDTPESRKNSDKVPGILEVYCVDVSRSMW